MTTLNKDVIILIGPIRSGKSTIANLLSERLNLPRYGMDKLRFEYYKESDYNEVEAEKINNNNGFLALCEYRKPYDIYAIKRVLKDCEKGIIDFGGGLSVYEDEKHLQQITTLLKPYRVVLLLPSENKEESLEILNVRMKEQEYQDYFSKKAIEDRKELNHLFINHPSNQLLAKYTFYTKNKTPEETCNEIINYFNS